MVNVKGNTCSNCCCHSCQRRSPEDVRCCCHCVCQDICVTIEIPGDPDCKCDLGTAIFSYDCFTESWNGTISCRELSIDLEFIIKSCDGSCYVCLKSDCLGMPNGTCPDDCIEIFADTGTGPGAGTGTGTGNDPQGFCKRLRVTWDSLDFSSCGEELTGTGTGTRGELCGLGTVSIECTDRVFRSCAGEECPTGTSCEGCDCNCRCVCLSYQLNGEPNGDDCNGDEVNVCWDESTESWRGTIPCIPELATGTAPDFTVDVEIFLETDPSGNCVLRLTTNIGSLRPTTDIEGQIGDPRILGGCPDFFESWLITHIDGSESRIDISCIDCAEECKIIFVPCCEDVAIPRTLIATIFSDDDDMEIGNGIIKYDRNNCVDEDCGCWKGEVNFCQQTVTILMCCIVPEESWEITALCSPEDETQSSLTVVCDPFRIQFNPISSCKPPILPCPDWYVLVTE